MHYFSDSNYIFNSWLCKKVDCFYFTKCFQDKMVFNIASVPIPGNPMSEDIAKENVFNGIFIPVYGSAILIKTIDINPNINSFIEQRKKCVFLRIIFNIIKTINVDDIDISDKCDIIIVFFPLKSKNFFSPYFIYKIIVLRI